MDPPCNVTAWENTAVRKISRAVREACHPLVKARLGTRYGSVFIGHNRRVVNPDGTVKMLWANPTKIPTSPVDPTVSVLRVNRSDGKPLAFLVNYACHSVVFGSDNRLYSTAYPGGMSKVVEQAFEG